MSRTIRNEKTKGWLDKLQQQRHDRKQARTLKADPFLFLDSNLEEVTT